MTLLTREELIALWDEHTRHEFVTQNLDATMATMVDEPYVNHVPTMVGGYGKELLAHFYGTDFIPSVPEDMKLTPTGRVVSVEDQAVVDEMVISLTHTTQMNWLLPGMPPTNKQIRFPLIAVVRFKDGKIHHEHIWWDQATVFKQLGLFPENFGARTFGSETADALIEDSKRIGS